MRYSFREADRENVVAQLFDSIELPPEIWAEKEAEIQRRAQQARDRVTGIPCGTR